MPDRLVRGSVDDHVAGIGPSLDALCEVHDVANDRVFDVLLRAE